ncbi:MAG: 3'-5' exonuclease [Candidatus Omnitrophota bacterium]
MDLSNNINDYDLVFLDLETTGLNVALGDAICEIGAFKVRNRRIVDKYHSLINPKKPIPEGAYRIHRISDKDVKGAPYFEQRADSLLSFLNNSVICVYNAKFDMSFLQGELNRIGSAAPNQPVIDVLLMARSLLSLPRYNLGEIARFLNVEPVGGLHRAMEDAFVAYKAFLNFTDILKQRKVETLSDVVVRYGYQSIGFNQWKTDS